MSTKKSDLYTLLRPHRIAAVLASIGLVLTIAPPARAGSKYGSAARGSYAITHPLERPSNPRTTASKGRVMNPPTIPDPLVREPQRIAAQIPDPSPNLRALAKGTSTRRGRYFYEKPGTLRMADSGSPNVVQRPIPPSPVIRRPPSTSRAALKTSGIGR